MFVCLFLQNLLHIPTPPLPLRTALRPTQQYVSGLKSSIKPPVKHNSQCLGSAFFPSTDFCSYICPGPRCGYRGDALDPGLLSHTSALEYCFYGRQHAPPLCILAAPGIVSRSQHSRTLVMSHTALPFPIFSGFFPVIQNQWSGLLTVTFIQELI